MTERGPSGAIPSTQKIDFRFAPASTWTPVCRPDDPHKTLVREDGALLYGFEQTHLAAWSFHRTVEFRAQTTHPPSSIRQRTEDARTPIVVTTVTYPNCRLELRTTGHRSPAGYRYDVVEWSVQVEGPADELLTGLHVDIYERSNVRHAGAGLTPGRAIYAFAPEDARAYPPFVDDVSEDENRDSGPRGNLVLLSQPHRLSLTHASGFRPASGFETLPVVARSGGTVRGAIILTLDGGPVDGLDLTWAQRALERERAYWHSLDTLDLPFHVPDAGLQDMLVAAARNILQARELDASGRPVFQVGPTVYRGLWIVDGHFLLEAAQYLHLSDDARHGMRALLSRVRADGSINAMSDLPGLGEHPHTKETGIALYTLVRQWELTGDDAWLQRLWPVVRGAVDYIAGLRRRARELPADSPAHGLMPPAFSDGGVAGARPELTTTLWTLTGLNHAARAACRLAPEDHQALSGMYESLLRDFQRVAGRYEVTLPGGGRFTPMVLPGSGSHHTMRAAEATGEHHRIRPESATWALAQSIWPGEVFGPDERIVRDFLRLLESLDADEQVPATTGWLPYRAVWTYYASFAAHVWLYAGRAGKALELLYGFCNHASPTRVWREEQPLTGTGHDQVWGDMPHNWASAELIRLVRNLLVFERDGRLDLLPGAPQAWMDDPAGLRVDRTPTRFGDVSLAARRRPSAEGTISVSLTPHEEPGATTPDCTLNVPADGVWRVEVNGSTVTTVHGPTRLSLAILEGTARSCRHDTPGEHGTR